MYPKQMNMLERKKYPKIVRVQKEKDQEVDQEVDQEIQYLGLQ